MLKERCLPGIAGLPAAHNYRPRYSIGAPTLDPAAMVWMFSSDALEALVGSRPQTYNGDVCTRCGDVVNVPARSK